MFLSGKYQFIIHVLMFVSVKYQFIVDVLMFLSVNKGNNKIDMLLIQTLKHQQ
jgi:hypothetical protein